MALVQRSTDRSTKVDKMVADSQAQIGERLRLVAMESRNARLQVQRRALALVPKAIQTLESLMVGEETPAQTRRLCALDILSLGGANTADGQLRDPTGQKALHEMTAGDLRQMLDVQRRAVAVLETGLMGEVIDADPGQNTTT
jgi:hypothetical protein